MPEASSDWLHFVPRQQKRKRAELVCVICHSKKVKCNLQARTGQGHSECSNCAANGQDCRIRASKRGKQRASTVHENEGRQNFDQLHQHGEEASASSTFPDFSFGRTTASTPQPLNHSSRNADNLNSPKAVQFASTESVHETTTQNRTLMASTSPGEGVCFTQSGDVDTGFLHVYGPENQLDAELQGLEPTVLPKKHNLSGPEQQELLQSFAETYWAYCYTWCPVLDRENLNEGMQNSPLLANAVALAASHVQPPLLEHEGPASYYSTAKAIFYNEEEADTLVCLKALSLFYWWAPRPPSTAQRNSSWWWNSMIIRIAQQMNFHREPPEGDPLRDRLCLSSRRKIWWTVFARERLTALCQSKPCIIDPEDCNISEPQMSDFSPDPSSQKKGEIFIYWIRLCGIIGKVAKYLSRASWASGAAFPSHLRQELVNWITSLPSHLQLGIDGTRTQFFDRDIHQLHLPYLTTIIILHLKRDAHDLPQALPPAILAASCTVRILRDILSRGNTRFLMPITCWYSATAFTALLQARGIQQFSREAEEGLEVLDRTVRQLQTMWASANIIRQGFDRLRNTSSSQASNMEHQLNSSARTFHRSTTEASWLQGSADHLVNHTHDDFDWTLLFPFVTPATNGIAEALLRDRTQGTSTIQTPVDPTFHENLLSQYQDLLEPFTEYSFDLSNPAFSIT